MNSRTTSRKIKKFKNLLPLLLLSINLLQAQFTIPTPPEKIYPVNDFAQVLTGEQVDRLNEKLIRYGDSTSTEILVTIVKKLNGEDPNLVGANWGQKWKIGQKKQDNGLILLLAIDDKKVTIQTGYGLEPYLTDALSRRIIENRIKPALRQGDYYSSIDQGTTAIFETLKDTYKNKKRPLKKDDNRKNWLFYMALTLFILYFFQSRSGGLRRRSVNYDDAPFTLSGMGKWSGNFGKGWSSSSRGGFGGFGGGGSFGGGGVSEDW
ncbi:MAG: TPM domain-containing protein [Flavobacteriales bacterium Tduv]